MPRILSFDYTIHCFPVPKIISPQNYPVLNSIHNATEFLVIIDGETVNLFGNRRFFIKLHYVCYGILTNYVSFMHGIYKKHNFLGKVMFHFPFHPSIHSILK